MAPQTTATTRPPSLGLVPGPEEQLMRETVHAIAARHGPAYYREVSATGSPATRLWEALGAGGYLGVHLPEEYGGGGLGLHELTAVFEETAAAGCPLLLLLLSPGIIGTILVRHGTPEQRERWLPSMADGSLTFSFALTEPDAGSNSHRVSTKATREGGRYIINGQKTFISSANEADLMMVVTKTGTDSRGRSELTLLIVDPTSEGVTLQSIPTAPMQPEQQFSVYFDDVGVDAADRIGEEGTGLRVAFDGMNPERILSAALSIGVGRWALDKACVYARERRVWSVPIGAHQGISHPLADAHVKLEQARLMMYKAAALYDADLPAGEAGNIAKLAAAEAGVLALDRAIQTHGGNGVALEYDLADYWFLARLQLIAPVSRENVLNHVAEHSLGLPRSY
jgi:alkylation response protein AidB-like acyl-CoA dehydrogenase